MFFAKKCKENSFLKWFTQGNTFEDRIYVARTSCLICTYLYTMDCMHCLKCNARCKEIELTSAHRIIERVEEFDFLFCKIVTGPLCIISVFVNFCHFFQTETNSCASFQIVTSPCFISGFIRL